jgi:hypothetical protein
LKALKNGIALKAYIRWESEIMEHLIHRSENEGINETEIAIADSQ